MLTLRVRSAVLVALAMAGVGRAAESPVVASAESLLDGQRVAVVTDALSAEWNVTAQGLTGERLRDARTGREIAFAGEVFQIVLADGTCYPASTLTLEGKSRGAVAAIPNASRLAARIPAEAVEASLRSADGRLRVRWRAVARTGAAYVRQEIEISALREDVVLKEIAWINGEIPAARTCGQVDGSVVVCGDFFLGCEDPHALNTVESPRRPIGGWASEDLELGKSRRKVWPLDAARLAAGPNQFVFQYERGPHRLDIARAVLLEDGREIARDEHHGRTGTSHVDNTYSLTLPQIKPQASYALAAELGTDPSLKLPAGQRVESFGKVVAVGTGGPVVCRVRRNAPLRRGETLVQSLVFGVAPPGQMRRAFLAYLERERAHPYRPFLHYNSWYDTAWQPFALNEANCVEAIRLFGERFIRPHGAVIDAMVFDDGWDDPKTLWQFHRGFPRGFTPLAEACRQHNTRLGVWLSPFGGYGEPRNQRLQLGRQQGYEINAAGFSLSGPKYYAAFKQACVGMIRNYGVNHFKFDGIAAGTYASGGAEYLLDTEAMRRLMLELRQEDPNVYINLTTGSWPSPFWLRFADSLWRQGGDMGLAGKGPRQQQWLTYRDQEVYRNIVRKSPLYPLNALMTQGVAYSRQGTAGDPTFTSAGFKDDVRAFFGAGTSLQELYIQPGKLTDADWQVLAEAAKWSRANADVLVDTHWVGGDPGKLAAYGYASWSPRKGIVMLRNPAEQPQEFALDVGQAFELPPGAATQYALKSPWTDQAAQPAQTAESGKPLRLRLQPFEIVVLDATPHGK